MKKLWWLLLCSIYLALLWGDERVSIAIPKFQEIGQAPQGSGVEIALFVAGALDSDRFQVKDRVHLKQWAQEQMINDPKRLDDLKQLKAQQVLLGTVVKTNTNYSVSYCIVDDSGNVLLEKDQVTAHNWDTLKTQLRLSLTKHALAPPGKNIWFRNILAALVGLAVLFVSILAIGKVLRYRGRCVYFEVTASLQGCRKVLYDRKEASDGLQRCAADLDSLLTQVKSVSRKKSEQCKNVWQRSLPCIQSLREKCLLKSPPTEELAGEIQKLQTLIQKDIYC